MKHSVFFDLLAKSHHRFDVRKSEEGIKVSFYIIPIDRVKKHCPIIGWMTLGFIISSPITVFVLDFIEKIDSLYFYLAGLFGLPIYMLSVMIPYVMYRDYIHSVRTATFGYAYLVIAEKISWQNQILWIPREKLTPLVLQKDYLKHQAVEYSDERLLIRYKRKEFELAASGFLREDMHKIKFLYEYYLQTDNILKIYEAYREIYEAGNRNEVKL